MSNISILELTVLIFSSISSFFLGYTTNVYKDTVKKFLLSMNNLSEAYRSMAVCAKNIAAGDGLTDAFEQRSKIQKVLTENSFALPGYLRSSFHKLDALNPDTAVGFANDVERAYRRHRIKKWLPFIPR